MTTGGCDGAHGRFDGVDIASVDHNTGTQLGQECCDRGPDPAGPADDNRAESAQWQVGHADGGACPNVMASRFQ